MEYTVKKLGQLAGISTRTLRYYDEIGILKPARISSSGYRIYGRNEVDQLQQILFYREMGVSLEEIKEIVNNPLFDRTQALKDHHGKLLEKKEQLDLLIANVEKTIAQIEGRIIMNDQQKFEGFKKTLIDENEKKYGKEVREKYGNEIADKSNERLKNMSQQEHDYIADLSEKILEVLSAAFKTGDPAGELAQQAADLHRQFITFYWGTYSKEAHAGLARMYVDDARFTAYYDKNQPGAAEFLRDAILIYTGQNK